MSDSQTRKGLMIGGIGVAAVLVGMFAIQQQMNAVAIAQSVGVEAFDTIPLQGLSLNSGEFLLLVDTTPALIETAHVALNIPCEIRPNQATSNIAVVAGVAPNVAPVDLEFVRPLSPNEKHCTFHVTLPNDSEDITDIAIINTSNHRITFNSGNFVTTSVATTYAD